MVVYKCVNDLIPSYKNPWFVDLQSNELNKVDIFVFSVEVHDKINCPYSVRDECQF